MAREASASCAGAIGGDRNAGPAVFSRHATSNGPYSSLGALCHSLRAELAAASTSTFPEYTTAELTLRPDAVLPLVRPSIGPYAEGGQHDLPGEFKTSPLPLAASQNGDADADADADDDPDDPAAAGLKHPHALCSAITNVTDPRQRQIVQRAAARGILHAIEAIDGYKYSFNNAWAAKDEEGARFSYICQDSRQNRDRHANGYPRTAKHLKESGDRGPRKPTYDCKGSVSVKFSTSRNMCDVYYRHYGIHDTVAARKLQRRSGSGPSQPPRKTSHDWPPQGTVLVRDEWNTGGLLAALQAENSASLGRLPVETPHAEPPSRTNKLLKRKREEMDEAPQPSAPQKQISLADLLKHSETTGPPAPIINYSRRRGGAAPVAYETPSWQTPAPPTNRPQNGQTYPQPYVHPYPLPYQPRSRPQPVVPLTPAATASQRAAIHSNSTGKPQPGTPQARQSPAQGLFTTMKMVTQAP